MSIGKAANMANANTNFESFPRRFVFELSVLLCAWLLTAPCSAGPAPDICVTDDLSRRVCLPRVPQRIVSFAPSLTELTFLLGAGDRLVGRTERCNHPQGASRVPEIGSYMKPDLERVIRLRPDLVITTTDGARPEAVERLTQLGLVVFVDDSRSLNHVINLVLRLGRLLGRDPEAERIARDFDQRLQAMRSLVLGAPAPTVLFAVGSRPLVVAGGKSFLGSLIKEARGANIAEHEPIPFPRFSIEEVIRQDPDLILVLDKECHDEECRAEWRRHVMLKAVREERIFPLDADLMARCTPRIIDGLEELVRLFHPGLLTRGN